MHAYLPRILFYLCICATFTIITRVLTRQYLRPVDALVLQEKDRDQN